MDKTPTSFDAANSILFIGSGFSAGATNIGREKLPTGNPLKSNLARILGVSPNDYSLRSIVADFRERPDLDLYQTLYETFTIAQPLDFQREILALPWSRIYTTNYDDLVPFCKRQSGSAFPTFSSDEVKPNRLPRQFSVHLHGCIRNATRENVYDQLVLDEGSYVRQIAAKPAWFDEFTRDLRYSDACYFLGYSLSDDHITALLLQTETARAKSYFVAKPEVDDFFRRRVAPYGQVLPIGFDGF
eukprot:gene20998-20925_t